MAIPRRGVSTGMALKGSRPKGEKPDDTEVVPPRGRNPDGAEAVHPEGGESGVGGGVKSLWTEGGMG